MILSELIENHTDLDAHIRAFEEFAGKKVLRQMIAELKTELEYSEASEI